jgi:Tat protein translocase TatB subunit
MPHLIVLFIVALVIFGPQKLPELARMLGKATAEFRKMTGDFRYALEEEVRELERQTRIREAEAAAAKTQPQPTPTPTPVEASPFEPTPVEPEGTVPRVESPVDSAVPVEPPSANGHATAVAPNSATPAHEKPSDDNAAV